MSGVGGGLGEKIKECLSAREVVEFYGFHPNRAGFVQCPFHQGDRHGSLKVYEGNKSGWHCFGCNAGGSVIDFTMLLFGIGFRQAAVRLNSDFQLGLTADSYSPTERSAILAARRREAERKAAAEQEYRAKAAEYRALWRVLIEESPQSWEDMSEQFVDAVARKCALEHWLDAHIGG